MRQTSVRRRRTSQEMKTQSALRSLLERGRLAQPILQNHKHSPEVEKLEKGRKWANATWLGRMKDLTFRAGGWRGGMGWNEGLEERWVTTFNNYLNLNIGVDFFFFHRSN
jgi:hypothetical protein